MDKTGYVSSFKNTINYRHSDARDEYLTFSPANSFCNSLLKLEVKANNIAKSTIKNTTKKSKTDKQKLSCPNPCKFPLFLKFKMETKYLCSLKFSVKLMKIFLSKPS